MTTQFNFGSAPTLATTSTPSTFTFGPLTTTSQSTLPSFNTSLTTTPFSLNTNALNSLLTSSLANTGVNPLGTTPTLTLTLTSAPTATTQTSTQQMTTFHGMGGTPSIASETATDQSADANKYNKDVSYIPPEMMPLVEALKNFVKEQKLIREENSQQRFSIQPILEVGSQIEDNLRLLLNKIEVDIQRNSKTMDSLKKDTNKLLSSAEMAYRISRVDVLQTPSSYTIAQNKYINASTNQYFLETINNFEQQMNTYSKQIQELRTHIDNMNKPYTSEELFQIMRKQHETLISLAAKVYAIHEEINELKSKLHSNYSSKFTDNTREPQINTLSDTNKSFVGPNPFAFTGDESLVIGSDNTPKELSNLQTTGLTNPLLFSSLTPNQSVSNTSSTFQFNPLVSTPGTTRTKRWTTS
ncbi:uncharacterized protein LOC128962267 [Oppia nitens]|uniref:uncharacterized protein LOC128962267 n=1 Tax=Oppia nitens TaxID=1686743 RepID=UPI0023D99CD6|nr:uncharacterized protein LOC128962267 [Oppia nitens]